MDSDLEPYFDDPAEQQAYEAFCEAQEASGKPFDLGEPALVCRWRMAHKQVPMLNRHIRALSQRRVNGAAPTSELISWAKQHIECSLADGAYEAVDGVLMIVVDVDGNAAMSVGEYEPLGDVSFSALAARAAEARREQGKTGVAPELLCAVQGGSLVIGAEADEHLCGTGTLVQQLAEVRKHEVSFEPELCEQDADDALGAAFLVSDEHGVVAAEDCCGAADEAAFVEFLAKGYAKLFE